MYSIDVFYSSLYHMFFVSVNELPAKTVPCFDVFMCMEVVCWFRGGYQHSFQQLRLQMKVVIYWGVWSLSVLFPQHYNGGLLCFRQELRKDSNQSKNWVFTLAKPELSLSIWKRQPLVSLSSIACLRRIAWNLIKVKNKMSREQTRSWPFVCVLYVW